jgi:chaperonin GroEL
MKNETTTKLLNGVNMLADTVKLTLGTKGRTVLFNDERNKPHITKDGVTVARHVFSKDDYENMVITVLREASMKTMLSSGDGTTTTMVLSQYLINEGVKLLEEGMSYYELSKQMDEATKDIVNYIKSESIDISEKPSLLKEIASVSANDVNIGEFIYSVIQDIGIYGDIEVKASQYLEKRVDKTKGMKIHKGWFESFMVNNLKEMKFTADNVRVLIVDGLIQSIPDFSMYIDYLQANGAEPIVVFCDDISDITLSQIQKWMDVSSYPMCFIQNDGFGDNKITIMNDLAALTSSTIVEPTTKFNPEYLGYAAQISADQLYTSIFPNENYIDNELVNEIVEDIKYSLEQDQNEDELDLSHRQRRFLEKRLANLTGGVAIIHAGGRTEMEMKELKDRLDDAVLATSSAIKQGVNVGGGFTYINCNNKLSNKNNSKGYNLVINSLESPFKQLLVNADLINYYDKYKKNILKNQAIDLRNGKIYKLSSNEYTVYDPTSVLTDAIQNAVAVSKSLLSIKNIIYDGNVIR